VSVTWYFGYPDGGKSQLRIAIPVRRVNSTDVYLLRQEINRRNSRRDWLLPFALVCWLKRTS